MFFILNSVFFFTLGSFYWKTVIRLPVGNRNLEQMFRSTFFLGFCSLLLSVRHFAKVIARRQSAPLADSCLPQVGQIHLVNWTNTFYKYDIHIGQLGQIHLTTLTHTRSSAEGQSAPVADLHFQTLFCSSQDLPSLYSFKLPRVQEKQKLSDILYNCTAANRNLKKYFAKYILRHFSNYANYAFP